MRLARNLLLAATAAIAAMAFMATSAFAQSVEVLDENTDPLAHCGDIVEDANHDISGGCEVVANSLVASPARTHDHTLLNEAVTTSCENEFAANIDEDGTGYIDTTETTIHTSPPPGFSPCPLEECDEADSTPPGGDHPELEWPISGMFEYGGDQKEMVVSFCIRTVAEPEGTGSTCTILVDVAQDPVTHVLTFTADQDPCHENPNDELSGVWQTNDDHDEVEIIHTHYPADSLG